MACRRKLKTRIGISTAFHYYRELDRKDESLPLTLLTHNAFWMQGTPFEGKHPGPGRREIIDGLAALYRSFAPDAICIQEIQSEETARDISSALKMKGLYTPGGAFPQYGGSILCDCAQLASRSENVERHWTKAHVAPRDFPALVLCSMHLPYGPEKSAIRLHELRGMLAAPPRPAIVCGDFNSLPDSEVHAEMEHAGYCDSALLSGDAATPTSFSGHRIDYVWLDESLRHRLAAYHVLETSRLAIENNDESKGGGTRAGRDARATGRFLSDHLPVLVKLN